MSHDKSLKALADSNRRLLFERLVQAPGYTHELVAWSGLTQPAVSQHLKVLLDAGLLKQLQQGRRTHYSVDSQTFSELNEYLQGLAGLLGSDASPASIDNKLLINRDVISKAAQQWSKAWPDIDANVYSVNMRLLLMGRHVERALKDTAEKYALQGSELLLLDVLQLSPGQSSTPTELQARLGVTKGAITKLMQGLEGRGLISRSISPSDRRVTHVHLTSNAHQVLVSMVEGHEYGPDHAAARRLPAPELAQLERLLCLYQGLIDAELQRRKSKI